ncbi:MAG: CAP domain-containing protein [Halobacteria archaeon]|nr:CAP domain-containing protein [Halobacteria archaeon]
MTHKHRNVESNRGSEGILSLKVVAIAVLVVLSVVVGTYLTVGYLSDVYYTSPSELNTTRVERAVHERVNQVRESHGVNPLSYDEELAGIAGNYSEQMATQGFFSHTEPDGDNYDDRYNQAGYDCVLRSENGSVAVDASGENLARLSYEHKKFNETDVAREVVEGWMKSSEHRKNMLSDRWRREGIGVYTTNSTVYVTQNFC